MQTMRYIFSKASCILGVVMLAACSGQQVQDALNDSSAATAVVAPPTQAALSAPDGAGWIQLEPGIEFRETQLTVSTMQILRFDPTFIQPRVAYDVAAPGRISEWQAALDTLAIVNGGYFDDQGRATALTIFDGVVRGASYEGFGGMFAVYSDGRVEVRSLSEQPYNEDEAIVQALQSAPMLVRNGAAVPQPNDDGQRARRSVVATDSAGRILVLVNGWPELSLSDLSTWLVAQPELEIMQALNLDGGSSTGLAVDTAELQFSIDSLVRVPQVLMFERR